MDLCVSPQWLYHHQEDDQIVILDASWYLPHMNRDAELEFEAGHIPKAMRFDIERVRDMSTYLPHMLPSPDVFAREVGAMGISNNHMIIVYDSVGLFSAPRVWWMFKVMGAKNVAILDGGLPAWIEADYSLVKGKEKRSPSVFTPVFDKKAVVGASDVLNALKDKTFSVVDARSSERFMGRVPEPRAGVKAGHMPGAKNIPYTMLIADGCLKPVNELQQVFKDAGVDVNTSIITTCGSGVTAAIISLALEKIGHPAKALYDGSWAQWGSRDDLPSRTLNLK